MVNRHRSAKMKIELIQQICLPLLHTPTPLKHPLFPPSLPCSRLPLLLYTFLPPHQAPCLRQGKACEFRVHTFLLMIYSPGGEFHLLPVPFPEPVASQ